MIYPVDSLIHPLNNPGQDYYESVTVVEKVYGIQLTNALQEYSVYLQVFVCVIL